jgi:hypothetical protein
MLGNNNVCLEGIIEGLELGWIEGDKLICGDG